MGLWPPSLGRTKRGLEWVAVSPPIGSPPSFLLIFSLGWRRLSYFMQKVMANEIATAWPGKERETKGKGGQNEQIAGLFEEEFSAQFSNYRVPLHLGNT